MRKILISLQFFLIPVLLLFVIYDTFFRGCLDRFRKSWVGTIQQPTKVTVSQIIGK